MKTTAPLLYVINLDRDTERMDSIAQNLRNLGLPYVRIPAVLGKELTNWEQYVDTRLYSARNRNPVPRLSEIGCYLSHIKALEAFVLTDQPWCVILEDDVEILPECLTVLRVLDEEDDWDLAKLFCFHSGMPVRKRALTPTHNLVVHLTQTTSAAAYAVNRHAAETLLRKLRPMTEQLDHAHDRPWETGLRIRTVRPLPVKLAPVSLISTINDAVPTRKRLPLKRAVRLLLSRTGKEIRRFGHGLKESFLSP